MNEYESESNSFFAITPLRINQFGFCTKLKSRGYVYDLMYLRYYEPKFSNFLYLKFKTQFCH